VKEIVEEHKETFDENNMRDFIDVYLKEIKEGNDPDFNGRPKLNLIVEKNLIEN